MSTTGITNEGFVAKRLEDVKAEIEQRFRDAYGKNINLSPESKAGQLVGIIASEITSIWELAECTYNSQYPPTAEGVNLDLVVAINGLTRLPATKSKVDLCLLGTVGTVVPAGTEISQDGNAETVFITSTDATIAAGVDEQQKLTFDSAPDSGDFKLTFNSETTAVIPFNAVASVVETALNNLPSLSSTPVSVVGDFTAGFTITFDATLLDQEALVVTDNNLLLGAGAVAIVVSEEVKGVPNSVEVAAEASVTGPIPAPADTMTIIDTPVTGLDSVTNKLDATLGTNEETDSELKLRRENSLQAAGAGTLESIRSRLLNLTGVLSVVGFENTTFITDLNGRPPKSYEMVVQGGDEAEICELIWETKPAGIQTVGSTTCPIIDSNGNPQTVYFSRPTAVEIYLELDLTTNTDFPASGPTDVLNAILAYGNALPVGGDVIVFPKLVAALCEVTGIEDVAVRIGTAASPTLDDNIPIEDNEISDWDSSRITVAVI